MKEAKVLGVHQLKNAREQNPTTLTILTKNYKCRYRYSKIKSIAKKYWAEPLFHFLGIALRYPTTIDTVVTFMFHSFLSSLARSKAETEELIIVLQN